jgi:7-carboxy-7-deazaguanine synthase
MRVIEVFDSVQGEGIWTGVPMTFVRFAGCNASDLGLGCVAWCDTPDSWDPSAGSEMTAEQVASAARLPRVCLTGGEPLLHGDMFADLVGLLQRSGRKVHVETNGTLDLPRASRPDWVTVSPKPPDHRISGGLLGLIHEIKLVVDGSFREEVAESLAESHPGVSVCLQPEWSQLSESGLKAAALVMKHPEWRLSIQLHRFLGLP